MHKINPDKIQMLSDTVQNCGGWVLRSWVWFLGRDYMQSISCEMLGWIKLQLESRLPGEISITSDIQMTPL